MGYKSAEPKPVGDIEVVTGYMKKGWKEKEESVLRVFSITTFYILGVFYLLSINTNGYEFVCTNTQSTHIKYT